jgi:hypothetical protein
MRSSPLDMKQSSPTTTSRALPPSFEVCPSSAENVHTYSAFTPHNYSIPFKQESPPSISYVASKWRGYGYTSYLCRHKYPFLTDIHSPTHLSFSKYGRRTSPSFRLDDDDDSVLPPLLPPPSLLSLLVFLRRMTFSHHHHHPQTK